MPRPRNGPVGCWSEAEDRALAAALDAMPYERLRSPALLMAVAKCCPQRTPDAVRNRAALLRPGRMHIRAIRLRRRLSRRLAKIGDMGFAVGLICGCSPEVLAWASGRRPGEVAAAIERVRADARRRGVAKARARRLCARLKLRGDHRALDPVPGRRLRRCLARNHWFLSDGAHQRVCPRCRRLAH